MTQRPYTPIEFNIDLVVYRVGETLFNLKGYEIQLNRLQPRDQHRKGRHVTLCSHASKIFKGALSILSSTHVTRFC